MSKKIESLTVEQKARTSEFVDKWLQIGLDTRPADRAMAEEGIREAYVSAGLPVPEKIVWCTSPIVALLVIAVLKKLNTNTVGATVRATVGDTVGDTVGATVRATVGDTVGDTVRDTVGATVRATVGATVGATVRDTVWATVRATVRATVWATVWATVRDTVWATVWATVWDTVRDTVWATVRATVWDTVRDTVWDTVRDTVWDTVWDTVRDTWRSDNILWGQQEAAWLSFYDFMREVLALKTETDSLNGLMKVAKSANWWWAYKNIVFICDRPKVVALDDRKRLHREDGPAVEYRDGWGCYVWHGVRVPADVIEHPELITVQQIEAEDNAEVRRVMTERYGEERYLLDCGAKVIDNDPCFGTLYVKTFDDDEPLAALRVENSTPEPDGTRRKFMIGVEASAYDGDAGRHAQAASASTWRDDSGKLIVPDWRTYKPLFES